MINSATKPSSFRHSGMVRKHQTRNLEIPRCAIAHRGSMPCIAPERRLRLVPASIRLHKIPGDDIGGAKSLVDEALRLQPFDLVADILDVELAVGIDIG